MSRPLPLAKVADEVGGLSFTSKMPCASWGIPATRCKTGGKLRKVEGTVCSKCYALKGRFVMPKVHDSYERRYQAFVESPTKWVLMMITWINRNLQRDPSYFRWFDNGDLQSKLMLTSILRVCRETPQVQHWLPTKEVKLIRWLIDSHHEIPSNLVIRVSSPRIGQAPLILRHKQVWGSTVGYDSGPQCPAYTQGGKCLDCRNCWDPKFAWINYPEH